MDVMRRLSGALLDGLFCVGKSIEESIQMCYDETDKKVLVKQKSIRAIELSASCETAAPDGRLKRKQENVC